MGDDRIKSGSAAFYIEKKVKRRKFVVVGISDYGVFFYLRKIAFKIVFAGKNAKRQYLIFGFFHGVFGN